jgi:hypothetical protein
LKYCLSLAIDNSCYHQCLTFTFKLKQEFTDRLFSLMLHIYPYQINACNNDVE